MEHQAVNIETLSKRERKFYELATVGGLDIAEAYQKAYRPKDSNSARPAISKKRKKRPELFASIEAYKRNLFLEAQRAQREAVIQDATHKALTQIEKREVLRQIITGELRDPVLVMINGEPKTVNKPTSVKYKIRAIEIDAKLAGHFAPIGVEHSANDQFISLMKAASERKKKREENKGDTPIDQGGKDTPQA